MAKTKANLLEDIAILHGTIERLEKQLEDEISKSMISDTEIRFLKERLEVFDDLIAEALGRNLALVQENQLLIRAEIITTFREVKAQHDQEESDRDNAFLSDLEERKNLEDLYKSTGIYY
ncbi:hypothetical protein QUA70_19810 [Microcoleus sp. LAD1_D5]|uniref:hypothetical protein n=1 Tax=Microcoleus sp. LAD1_D5 TaxID=2818813 RepID=UPI002FD425FE